MIKITTSSSTKIKRLLIFCMFLWRPKAGFAAFPLVQSFARKKCGRRQRQEAGNGLFDCTTSTSRRVRVSDSDSISHLSLPFFLTLLSVNSQMWKSKTRLQTIRGFLFIPWCQTGDASFHRRRLFLCILDPINIFKITTNSYTIAIYETFDILRILFHTS